MQLDQRCCKWDTVPAQLPPGADLAMMLLFTQGEPEEKTLAPVPPPRQACASCKQQVWPDSAANILLCLHGTASTCLLPARRRVLRQEAGNRQRSSLPAPSTTTDSPEKNGDEGGAGRQARRGCKVPRGGRGGEPASVCVSCSVGWRPCLPSGSQCGAESGQREREDSQPHGVDALPPLWGSFPPRCSQALASTIQACTQAWGPLCSPCWRGAKRQLPADAIRMDNTNGVHHEPQPQKCHGAVSTWTLPRP